MPRRTRHAAPVLDREMIGALQTRLLGWYAANGRDLPWRKTRDPYAVLVSEIMLQQTQVSRVLPRFATWMHAFPRLEELADAPLASVLRAWQGLGYNNRARRLRECALRCCRNGSPAALPLTPSGLRELPGIGVYTARAVLVFANNTDIAAVDTNVRRVLTHELELPPDLPASALQAVADAVLPQGRSRDWHNALMDYGALVLTAKAAGLRPMRRQGAFLGSRRWYRSRLLKALLETGPLTRSDLAAALDVEPATLTEILILLERDGLVDCSQERIRIA